MITVIASTNRNNSEAFRFAQHAHNTLQEKGAESCLLNLADLPSEMFHPDMYVSPEHQNEELSRIQDEYILPAEKFLFVIPEYNGGVPGALKLFIDACSVRELKASFDAKKAALLGIAAGRSGNLRGMLHFVGVLNYLGVIVMPNLQPISGIGKLVGDSGKIEDVNTLGIIDQQLEALLKF